MSLASVDDLDSILQDLAEPSARDRGGSAVSDSPGLSSFSHVEAGDSSPRGESNKNTSLSLPPAIIAASCTSRKYKLWICPDEGHNLCFKIISQGGATFCILSNCSTNHKSGRHFHPRSGDIYVMKTTSSVFVAPTISSKSINIELLSKWLEDACPIDEWHKRFLLLKQEIENPFDRLSSEKISQSDLEAKDTFVSTALAFKTPKKKPVSFYSESFNDLPELASLTTKLDPEDNLYSSLDDKFSSLVHVLETMNSTQTNDSSNMINGFDNIDLRLSQLKDKMGSQPEFLDTKFTAPNLWLSLGLIADELSQIPSQAGVSKQEVLTMISSKFDNGNIERLIQDTFLPVNKQIKSLNDFAVNAVRLLNQKISNLPATAETSQANSNIDFAEREQRLWDKVNELQSELASYRSSQDESTIKFGKLGIRSSKEMDAWMEINHPGQNFGLLVDFHLVMEHVQVQITGQKLISNFEKIYKMSLDSNNQALAISSFEARVPRFFSSESRHFVRKDESYFSAIKCWDDWDLPHDGHRDRLNQELHLFKQGHQFLIDTELTPMTPFHTLCNLALTETVAWIEGLMKFLDDTFNEYSCSRFGQKKAWHITTRLAKALVDKVAAPRNSVQNSFKIHELHFVSKSIAYASLRSLDVMLAISSCNFKNSPIITAELSKFLALNSNLEVVESIQTKMKTLESENSTIKKDVKAASNAAHTASNKWDSTYKSLIDDLKKRVKSLESRN